MILFPIQPTLILDVPYFDLCLLNTPYAAAILHAVINKRLDTSNYTHSWKFLPLHSASSHKNIPTLTLLPGNLPEMEEIHRGWALLDETIIIVNINTIHHTVNTSDTTENGHTSHEIYT